MKSWLLIPLALVALVVAVPSSQGAGLFRKKSCASDCGPTQTIVGWKTEKREVEVCDYVIEKRKFNVTEYKTEIEKRKVTSYKKKEITETKPYTFTIYAKVKEIHKVDYWVCEPSTTEELRKVTYDEGAWTVQLVEKVCHTTSSCKKRGGLFGRKKCCDSGCEPVCEVTKVVCEKKVWVPKLVTKEEKVKVTSYKHVKKTRDVEVWVCKPITKTEPRTYVSCTWSPVEELVDVRVCKPYTVEKIVDVKVRKLVKKTIEVKIPVYGECAPVYVECGSQKKGSCK